MEPTSLDRPDADAATIDEANDAVFDALADAHRRFVVAYLHDRDEPVALETLAAAVADRDAAADEREARIRLHHTHLPKLERAGVVERDEGIGLGPTGDVALSLIARV